MINSDIYRSVSANVHKQENGTHFELSHSESLFLLRKIILSTQEGESRLRSFVRISPAVEKIVAYNPVGPCSQLHELSPLL